MSEFSIGRLRGGYCVYWDDASTGKRRRYQLSARTRAEAEPEARDRFFKEHAVSRDLTVREVWGLYVTSLGDKPTATTMGHTGKAVLTHFGALYPRQITDADCEAYAEKRRAEGRATGTIWTELGHLRSALAWGAKKGLLARAPDIVRPPKPDSAVVPLSDAEVVSLIDGCAAPHVRLAVILLITTAGRVGAILDLTWDRVDFERGTINLRLPDGVKRKGRAVVPMNRLSRAALERAYQARLSEHVVEFGSERVRTIRTGFAAAVKRAGIGRKIGPHDLRHTAAVKMLERGVPIEKVSQYLGHSSVAVTFRIYARYLPEHMADAAEVLEFTSLRAAPLRFGEP